MVESGGSPKTAAKKPPESLDAPRTSPITFRSTPITAPIAPQRAPNWFQDTGPHSLAGLPNGDSSFLLYDEEGLFDDETSTTNDMDGPAATGGVNSFLNIHTASYANEGADHFSPGNVDVVASCPMGPLSGPGSGFGTRAGSARDEDTSIFPTRVFSAASIPSSYFKLSPQAKAAHTGPCGPDHHVGGAASALMAPADDGLGAVDIVDTTDDFLNTGDNQHPQSPVLLLESPCLFPCSATVHHPAVSNHLLLLAGRRQSNSASADVSPAEKASTPFFNPGLTTSTNGQAQAGPWGDHTPSTLVSEDYIASPHNLASSTRASHHAATPVLHARPAYLPPSEQEIGGSTGASWNMMTSANVGATPGSAAAASGQNTGTSAASSSHRQRNTSPTRRPKRAPAKGWWKTEICRFWRDGAGCRNDTNCRWAHGEHELRVLVSPTNPTPPDISPTRSPAHHPNGGMPGGATASSQSGGGHVSKGKGQTSGPVITGVGTPPDGNTSQSSAQASVSWVALQLGAAAAAGPSLSPNSPNKLRTSNKFVCGASTATTQDCADQIGQFWFALIEKFTNPLKSPPDETAYLSDGCSMITRPTYWSDLLAGDRSSEVCDLCGATDSEGNIDSRHRICGIDPLPFSADGNEETTPTTSATYVDASTTATTPYALDAPFLVYSCLRCRETAKMVSSRFYWSATIGGDKRKLILMIYKFLHAIDDWRWFSMMAESDAEFEDVYFRRTETPWVRHKQLVFRCILSIKYCWEAMPLNRRTKLASLEVAPQMSFLGWIAHAKQPALFAAMALQGCPVLLPSNSVHMLPSRCRSVRGKAVGEGSPI